MAWTQLAGDGLLPPGTDLTWLIDTTAIMASAETYLLVSRMLHWDLDAYQEWLTVTWTRLLAGSVVDGGEEGGVGADQGGVL